MVVVRCFPTHCLHFTGQALWAVIWACLECWSNIKVLEAWAVEPLKRWLLHCVSCTRKAQTVREGFSFIWPSPLDKTGGRYNPKHLSAVDLQTPHSEAKGLLPPPPKHDKIKVQNLIRGCYQMQQHLQDDGWLKFVLKGWIIQHQQPWEQMHWWQGVKFTEKKAFWFVDYSVILQPFTLMS